MITANVIVSLTLLQLIIYAACGFDKGANRMSDKNAEKGRSARGDEGEDCGCAFVIDGANGSGGGVNFCNAPRESDSAYCARHHALCRLPRGSAAEARGLREIEALAKAVEGRRGRE